MSTPRQSCHATVRPASAAWWARVLMLLLFVFQVGYTFFHLGTEHHSSNAPQLAALVEPAHHESHDHHHHDSDHQPHAASDHQLQMRPQPTVNLLVVDFIVSEISFSLIQPETFVSRIIAEAEHAPGTIPPDPLQPRAPPVA
jgi:hypothetical protein